ncbi:OLC1v1000341C1 [Oldenlandia corymbosa var. corymbosa]|uniref:Tafazzin family protein n=1 Tax=Oldenlandia corymbosa var. corymbosa TaxID=529605 RepID=A0AAV1D5L6_OLDCO|nr:OLC1v1000341C1 [Oldenlandia corymbosa var. corymbosa]
MVVERWIESAVGDVIKDGARLVQVRLKHRFRVAVDRRHQMQPVFSHGYFAPTLQRWLERFRDFRRESLPSSAAFYRKRVSEDIGRESESLLTRVLQAVAVPVLGNVSYVFMHGLNRVQIYGAEKLQQAVLHRPRDKSLVTVSNHVASVDDPLVISSLLPPSVLLDANKLRWTLCATDRCFRNSFTSAFFKHVKVLPVSRGNGIYQKGMDIAISKLNRGEWVHIFPEGSRSRDGGKTIAKVKRGVGRMILDADNAPIVLPFVHSGMEEVMPVGAKLPRVGKTVTVLVGDPINFDDLLAAEKQQKLCRKKLYDAMSERIGDRLQKLKAQVDRLKIQQSLQLQNYPTKVNNKSAGILRQVDWESLGEGEEGHTRVEDYLTSKAPLPLLESDAENFHLKERSSISMMDFFSDGGISSRIRRLKDSTELMGFAARSVFPNDRTYGNKDKVARSESIEDME